MGFGILRYLSSDPDVVAHMEAALEPQVFFNYLGPDGSKELGRLHKLQVFGGFHLDLGARRLCPLTVGIPVVADKLVLKWEHNVNLHSPETIRPLAQRSREVLLWLINEYRTRGGGS